MTGYRCIACETRQSVDFTGYNCPCCGQNLDVEYDYAGIKSRLTSPYFGNSARRDQFKYAPLLPLNTVDSAPPLRVGRTPLYQADRLGALVGLRHLWIKDEGLNPSQSFKDRASAMILARARETGVQVVAAASTGNAGSSMACMAASVGMRCVVFVPVTAPPAKITQLLIYGAVVIAVQGTYDQAFELCEKVCEVKGWFNRNTGYNPFTREGKKTAAFEIVEQLGWQPPDRIVVPVGDGNIISGIWKGLRDLQRVGVLKTLPRVDGTQAQGSAAVTRAIERLRTETSGSTVNWKNVVIEPVVADTLADSISVNQPRDGLAAMRAVWESGGEVVAVSDAEILAALKEVALYSGVFVEPSCACAWAGLRQLRAAGRVDPEERVVCLLTGNGLKDIDNARKAAGAPRVVAPDLDQVLAHIAMDERR